MSGDLRESEVEPASFTAGDDYIDSRDIIERIASLEAEEYLDDEDEAELLVLKAVDEEGSQNAPDWSSGETMIHEGYFTEYAEELASDIGAIDRNASWPLSFIDWEAAADALKMDYATVDFDGQTYYVR